MNQIIFKPYFVQKGPGPHLHNFMLTQDEQGDVFHSKIVIDKSGIKIDNAEKKFSITVRWNVEGFGYLFIPADNEGAFYEASANGTIEFNLNYELAKTRIYRIRLRIDKFRNDGFIPSTEFQKNFEIASDYLEKANTNTGELCAVYSQSSLKYSMNAAEMLEMEKARFDIAKNGVRKDYLFGCDTRGYFKMNEELFFERFTELFNFATITHYLIGDIINFEENEGKKQFAEREKLLDELIKRDVTVLGRPLLWLHKWVTPNWLKMKSFDQLKLYLEKHITDVIGYYGDKIKVWEVVNEMHDWANELELNNDQVVEITKFACDVARAANPNIKLLINNCCPFAEYVQLQKWGVSDAKFSQRTPYRFTKDVIEAGADFDLIGAQVYFIHRTLPETIGFLERYGGLGKKMHLAEIGSPSKGITLEFHEEDLDWSTQPYEWHRHWDEELQADWLEDTFTIGYSKPFIEATNWYDFADPYGFLKSGGIIRSINGEKKSACDRLIKLRKSFGNY